MVKQVHHYKVENYFDNSTKKIVDVIEKINEVHEVNEKDQDKVEKAKAEVDDDHDSYFKKKVEIVKIFEMIKNFQKET